MGKARTQEEFIALVQKAWGDKLDFSDTVYGKNCMEKVKVLCPKHGEFYKSPDELIRKHSGCPKCGRQINAAKARKTQEAFIADVTRIHGERYDFSESVYKDRMTPVKVICKEHGPFYITPHSLLDKCGCPECARVKCQIVNLKTKEQFIVTR